MTFKELGLIDPILKSIEEQGYERPTPIQKKAIPILLKRRDLMGCAQTGTGKTAAFSIPIIQHLVNDDQNVPGKRKIKALIVTPTRELAIQIDDNLTQYAKYTRIKNVVIFGGVKQGRQVDQLKQGTDILVATPGRLLDLQGQGIISLEDLSYFVLDEADQMLDMGFIHDIKKILKLIPQKRQSLFFSATMPKSIVELSKKILGSYESVTIKPEQATAERVEQAIYHVNKQNKINLLIDILRERKADSTLVFSRTKYGADKIVRKLMKADIQAAAIHGNKTQNNRQRALNAFKEGKVRVLVATDIAARGIDVSELALVINYDLPNVPETYVHRIGRTGRASASGIALSFSMPDDGANLKAIQKLINQQIPVIDNHAYVGMVDQPIEQKHPNKQGNRSSRNGKKSRAQQAKGERRGKKDGPQKSGGSNSKKQGKEQIKSTKSNQNKRDERSKNEEQPFAETKTKRNPSKKKSRNKNKRRHNRDHDPITGKKKPDRSYLNLLD